MSDATIRCTVCEGSEVVIVHRAVAAYGYYSGGFYVILMGAGDEPTYKVAETSFEDFDLWFRTHAGSGQTDGRHG